MYGTQSRHKTSYLISCAYTVKFHEIEYFSADNCFNNYSFYDLFASQIPLDDIYL